MRIFLNILTHGDERAGIKVAKEISRLKLKKGEVVVHRANELAYKKRKRFIDQDLNRSFPGKRSGNHEQKLAAKILPLTLLADIVIDIHSTKSGLKDAVIVTKLNKRTKDCLEAIGPKYVLYMRATKDNALMSKAKIGIAFEYGKENDPAVVKKVVRDIKRLLVYLKMIDGGASKRGKTLWFDVYGTVPKPKGARLSAMVRNYKRIKKGEKFATASGKPLVARQDFYPILFGENSYKEVFGFSARLLK